MAKSAWFENIYYVLSDGKMAKNCKIIMVNIMRSIILLSA